MSELTLVDTHAHYYNFCDFETYFNYAYLNMKTAATRMEAVSYNFVICLLETENSQWFEKLLLIATSSAKLGEWSIKSVDNNQALALTRNENESLIIVPGRQVITAENLEVIIVGLVKNIPYRKQVNYYVDEFSQSYLVIIPWGVGKWLGKRGKRVSQLLSENRNPYALGDNSGRTRLWSNIRQFKQAKKIGKGILAGSDPLPVTGQFKKVATYGSAITGSIQGKDLYKQIRERLLDTQSGNVKTYGKVDGLFDFVVSQFLLRINSVR